MTQTQQGCRELTPWRVLVEGRFETSLLALVYCLTSLYRVVLPFVSHSFLVIVDSKVIVKPIHHYFSPFWSNFARRQPIKRQDVAFHLCLSSYLTKPFDSYHTQDVYLLSSTLVAVLQHHIFVFSSS